MIGQPHEAKSRGGLRLIPWFLLTLVAGFLLGLRVQVYLRSARSLPADINGIDELLPRAGQRILVISPHCDDETLGCGGLIYEALKAKAEVWVVVCTNGDAYMISAANERKRLPFRPQEMIAFGRERQGETTRAVETLGLPRSHLLFLGYPDRGTDQLWKSHWFDNNLFTSPYTRCDRSPYANSLTPSAPYCGESVVSDLTKVLDMVRPDYVFCPHPNDAHEDHWAVNAFTMASLEELRLEGKRLPRVFTYLIHRGDYPVPRGLRPTASLVPPGILQEIDTHWVSLPLSPGAEAAKRKAVMEYGSQLRFMRRHLLSFIRRNEVFGTMHAQEVPVGEEPAQLIQDPTDDCVTRELLAAGDISGIWLSRHLDRLHVTVRVPYGTSDDLEYSLYCHCFIPGKSGVEVIHGEIVVGRRSSAVFRGRDGRVLNVVVSARRGDRDLDVVLRLDALRHPVSMIVGARTEFAGLTVDQTAFRVVRLDQHNGAEKPTQKAMQKTPAKKVG